MNANMRYILIIVTVSLSIVTCQSAYGDQLPADISQSVYCTSAFKQVEQATKPLREQLDGLDTNSAGFASEVTGIYDKQLRLTYLRLACGENDAAYLDAADLWDMSPGEPEPYLITVMAFAEQGDTASLYKIYKSKFNEVIARRQGRSAYYKYLAFLITRAVLCDSHESTPCEALRSAKYQYKFTNDTPLSVRAVVQALAEHKQPSESDLDALPADVAPTRDLVTFIEYFDEKADVSRAKRLDLLKQYALSKSGY